MIVAFDGDIDVDYAWMMNMNHCYVDENDYNCDQQQSEKNLMEIFHEWYD